MFSFGEEWCVGELRLMSGTHRRLHTICLSTMLLLLAPLRRMDETSRALLNPPCRQVLSTNLVSCLSRNMHSKMLVPFSVTATCTRATPTTTCWRPLPHALRCMIICSVMFYPLLFRICMYGTSVYNCLRRMRAVKC